MRMHQQSTCPRPRRVMVVGPCASGKSTLVRGLRELGHEAIACGQEHSEIATLWRHAAPDVVIALDVDLSTVRRRRGADWPEQLHLVQKRRLAAAVAAADLVLDSAALDATALLDAAHSALNALGAPNNTGALIQRSDSAPDDCRIRSSD